MSEEMETPKHPSYENLYEEVNFTRLTPDSTYGL